MPTQAYTSALQSTQALVFLRDEYPYFVGHGFDWNELSGDWQIKQPVFYGTLSGGDQVSTNVEFSQSLTASERSSSLDLGFDIAGGIGLVQFGASLSNSNHTSSSFLSSAFHINFVKKYHPRIVNLTVPGSFTLTPAAAAIINNTAGLSPADQALAWRQQFGRYVAVGHGLRMRGGISVSLTNQQSMSSSRTFAALEGAYGGVSGSASLAAAAQQALSASGIQVDLDWESLATPAIGIPVSAAQLATPAQQQAFVDTIQAAVNNPQSGAPISTGLYLLPISAFPGVPGSFQTTSWDTLYLNQAGTEARLSRDVLLQSQRYNTPASFRAFLLDRPIPGYLPATTYGAELDSKRLALLVALDGLWTATRNYLGAAPGATGAPGNELQNRINATTLARTNLENALYVLDSVLQAIPVQTVTACRVTTGTMQGQSSCLWDAYTLNTFRIQITGFPFFPTSSFTELVELKSQLLSGAEQLSAGPLVDTGNAYQVHQAENGACPTNPSVRPYEFYKLSPNPTALSFTRQSGLYNITMEVPAVRVQDRADKIIFRFGDQLGRMGEVQYLTTLPLVQCQ